MRKLGETRIGISTLYLFQAFFITPKADLKLYFQFKEALIQFLSLVLQWFYVFLQNESMTLIYIILGLYFGLLFAIGIASSKRVGSLEDFFVGGKKLNFWVVAFSSRATGSSAWLLLGVSGMAALVGLHTLWILVGELIGISVAWFLMAPRFKAQTDQLGSITIPDYLADKFPSKNNVLRVLSASVLCIFSLIYISSLIDATGGAFESFLGWNYYAGICFGFFVVVVYIFFGGFVAVAYSDLFQGVMMLFALVFLPIATFFFIDASIGTITAELNVIDSNLLSVWGPYESALLNACSIIGLLAIGLGYMGAPQMFVRFISVKNQAELKKGRYVAVGFTILADLSAIAIGLLGRYLFTEAGVDPESILGDGGEAVFSKLVDQVLPLILVGIYTAAILSAIMSTIDSLLVVASSAVTRDIYQKALGKDWGVKKMTKLSRNITLMMALLALSITLSVSLLSDSRAIFWFVIFGWSGIGCAFCPAMLLALFYKGYNQKGVLASMIVGFVCVPIFKFVVPALPEVGIYFSYISEMLPSFILALVAGFIVSKT